jgi:hypothetical protein
VPLIWFIKTIGGGGTTYDGKREIIKGRKQIDKIKIIALPAVLFNAMIISGWPEKHPWLLCRAPFGKKCKVKMFE